jgi:hypothetical protein
VPKRRHCERHAEKNQRPESGAMNQFIERPRTMRNVIRLKDRFGERHQQHYKRTDAQPRHTAATIAPQLPGMRDRPRARLNHRARPSSQDIAFRLLSAFATISSITDAWLQCRNAQFTRIKGALVLEFSSCLDSSQSKKARKKACVQTSWPQRNNSRQPTNTGERGAVRNATVDAAPGDLHGGHRCREHWFALCLSLSPGFTQRPPHWRTIAGSVAADSRMPPANGAVVITTARVTRAYRRQRVAGWSTVSSCRLMRRCRLRRPTVRSRYADGLTDRGAACSVSSPAYRKESGPITASAARILRATNDCGLQARFARRPPRRRTR